MRRLSLLLILTAGLALLATPGASSRGTVQTFTDPAGDSGGAPDVTQSTADNDTANNITLTITTNQPTLAADAALLVPLDTDQNASTGQGGADFLFAVDATGYNLSMWNGSTYVDAPTTTAHVSYSSGVARFTINKSELGNTSAFNFFVLSVQIQNGAVAAHDLAPDTGVYSYTLVAAPPPPTTTTTAPPPPPPPPTVGLGRVGPKAPGLHAGRAFTVAAHVTTTAATVRVRCVVKVSGRIVRVTGAYTRATHTASCRGIVPAGTAGKRLAGTMTVTISGDRAAKSFSLLIGK